MRFPTHLRLFGTLPSPDLYVRARIQDWHGWTPDLLPIIFAGECIKKQGNKDHAPGHLAAAFHATLILLVLMYLDTRRSSSEMMPAWMYLYGLAYDEQGFSVYIHFPKPRVSGDRLEWDFVSLLLTSKFKAIDYDRGRRMRALAFLFKIRSHSFFLLEQLRSWASNRSGTVSNLKKLVARAELETGKVRMFDLYSFVVCLFLLQIPTLDLD